MLRNMAWSSFLRKVKKAWQGKHVDVLFESSGFMLQTNIAKSNKRVDVGHGC